MFFFVISGYLITHVLISDLQKKKFRFSEFYFRRARRILPALYVLIIITLISGYFFFSPIHLSRLGQSSVSSAWGTSNFFFWYEYGYFEFQKLYKPLLHTWSLSVLLQFYIIWPIFIFVFYKIFKENIKIIILLVILFCLIFSMIYSERTTGFFYFPGFRLYEFAIGSFTYFIKKNTKLKFNDAYFIVGILILILASIFFDKNDIFPGYKALIPCLSTSLLLVVSGNLNYFKDLILNKLLIYIGKISYSLYLIHWPLLIFYNYLIFHPISFYEKIILLIISTLLSIFLYNFVELPFKKKANEKFLLSDGKFTIYLISFMSVIILISFLFVFNKGLENRISDEKISTIHKLNDEIKVRENMQESIVNRHNNDNYFEKDKSLIKTLILGNSHAFDLYFALINNEKFLSSLDIEFKAVDFEYFKKKNFNATIAEYIKKNIFKNYQIELAFNNVKKDPVTLKLLSSADVIILNSRWGYKTDFQSIVNYIKNNSSGKIIIISRIPLFKDIPYLHVQYDNNLNYIANATRDKEVDLLNQKIKKDTEILNVEYFDRTKLACEPSKCIVKDNNNLLYSDTDHWSNEGAIFYGKRLYDYGFLDLIKK